MEFGLGAGSYWDGISAFGGPRRTPGEAYQAFKDALHIMRGMWDNAGGRFTYEGEFYQVKGIKPGPMPAHRIPMWVGARGPRMLRLLGRMEMVSLFLITMISQKTCWNSTATSIREQTRLAESTPRSAAAIT